MNLISFFLKLTVRLRDLRYIPEEKIDEENHIGLVDPLSRGSLDD